MSYSTVVLIVGLLALLVIVAVMRFAIRAWSMPTLPEPSKLPTVNPRSLKAGRKGGAA